MGRKKLVKVNPLENVSINHDENKTAEKQIYLKSDLSGVSREEIKELVKVEAFKAQSAVITELTENDLKIAKLVAKGYTDDEIKSRHNITDKYLFNLKCNPNFTREVQTYTYSEGFSTEDFRVQMLNRIGESLFEGIVENIAEGEMKNLGLEKQLKFTKEFVQLVNEMQKDKGGSKADISIIIQQSAIDQDRVIKNEAGQVRVKSRFPIIDNDSGEIIGENLDVYKIERE